MKEKKTRVRVVHPCELVGTGYKYLWKQSPKDFAAKVVYEFDEKK